MRLSAAGLCRIFGACSIAVLCLACTGRTLDVGVAKEEDDGGVDADIADASIADVADVIEPAIPLGFQIDGVPCTPRIDGGGWPIWQYDFLANCGPLGQARFIVKGDGSFPYPQKCSVVTQMYLGMDAEGDAGEVSYEAKPGRGTCSVISGPTPQDATTPLVVEGTLQSAYDPKRSHHVTYRER